MYYILKGDMDKLPNLTNPPTDKHWLGRYPQVMWCSCSAFGWGHNQGSGQIKNLIFLLLLKWLPVKTLCSCQN